jgi:hypothetical protein
MRIGELVGKLSGLAIGICCLGGCASDPRPSPYSASADAGSLSREQIREMPLLDRPDRPGHFVGNSVRSVNRWFNGDSPSDAGTINY